jgi:hypothetical protein
MAMGNLSLVSSNILMEHCGKLALYMTQHKLLQLLQHVDDSFVV